MKWKFWKRKAKPTKEEDLGRYILDLFYTKDRMVNVNEFLMRKSFDKDFKSLKAKRKEVR